jgi:chromosome segregation ATPase
MDKTLRSILWILVGLVVLSSFSTAWFFLSKEKLYNEYTNLEELFKTTMDKLNTELTLAAMEKTELKSKLQAIEKKFSILEASHRSLSSENETAVSERDDLKRELSSVKKGKAFLEKRLREIESDMFVANLLKQKVGLEVEIERLKNEIEPKNQVISMLKAESVDKDLRLAKLQEEKNLVEQSLKDSEQVAQIISNDFLREKDVNKDDKRMSEKFALENNALKSRISKFEEIAKEYNNLLAEKESMNAKLARLESDVEYKNHEINKFKIALQESAVKSQETRAEAYHSPEEVDLPPIRAQKTAKLTTPSLERLGEKLELKGRIVTVNKEHNFVVIDLGKQDGIDIGNKLNVYRGETFLGSVEIIQTRDRIAAANIKDLKEGLSIEINDTVVKR